MVNRGVLINTGRGGGSKGIGEIRGPRIQTLFTPTFEETRPCVVVLNTKKLK